jgi:HlyD family secretion protein
MNWRSKWVKWAVAVAAVALAAAAWTQWKKANPPPEVPRYRTAAVDRGAISQAVLANGTVQPVNTVNVGTQVSGTVLERSADFNDHVKKGQILLRLDPATLQARLRQTQAQLGSAEATLALSRSTVERNERLVAQGFISALALDQSQRELAAAAAGVEVARAQMDAAQTDVGNSVIRSPVDGVVIKRNIEVGQTVAASYQTPDLYQIAQDLRQMRIHTNVSEADVGLIRPGQLARFIVDAYPEREFEGKVEQFRLNSTSSQGVVTYPIVVAVDNSDELLKPGMTAQVRIVVASKQGVVRIPTAALRFKPDDDELKGPVAAASAASAGAAASSASGAAAAASAARATAAASAASADDDGLLAARRDGARIFRVYTVGPEQKPQLHEVTIGVSNTRFTEMLTGPLKAGDELITRRAEPAGGKK